MTFNTLAFAVFLFLAFILYWVIPPKYSWVVILAANCAFYFGFGICNTILLLAVSSFAYVFAGYIEKPGEIRKRKKIYKFSIASCLLCLAGFKYTEFLLGTIDNVFAVDVQSAVGKIIVPVGISFYIFQTASYLTDVYKGKIEPERQYGIFLAYATFFPIITSGPIERAGNILPQIKEEHQFDYSKAMYGAKLILWGIFQKYVIADTLAEYSDKIFSDVYLYKGSVLLLASLFFTIQIYCDFSGYSDIARGIAKLFGIELTKNFKSPYFSSSIKDFWSRWHISLSTWFKDYLYIPLGGNRVSKLRHAVNLMITFLVSGLWHGANWTFVFWGGIHGLGQIAENRLGIRSCGENRKSIKYWIKTILVFLFVSFAWIFFRMGNIQQAVYVVCNVFVGIRSPIRYLTAGKWAMELRMYEIILIVFFILLLALYDYYNYNADVIEWVTEQKKYIKYPLYAVVLFSVVFFHAIGNVSFIYAQF